VNPEADMNRRTFFFASSGAVAGSLLVPGFAEADGADKSPFAGSGLRTGKLKPLRHKEVPGFLCAAQIAPHHTAHYGGALKAVVGVEEKLEGQ
jgi:superoxide dismutase, Fe-Mn family